MSNITQNNTIIMQRICNYDNPWKCSCLVCIEKVCSGEYNHLLVSTDSPLESTKFVVKLRYHIDSAYMFSVSTTPSTFLYDLRHSVCAFKLLTSNKWFLLTYQKFAKVSYGKLLKFTTHTRECVRVMAAFYLQHFNDVWEHYGYLGSGFAKDGTRYSVRLGNKRRKI
jgi:hypothetical protein